MKKTDALMQVLSTFPREVLEEAMATAIVILSGISTGEVCSPPASSATNILVSILKLSGVEANIIHCDTEEEAAEIMDRLQASDAAAQYDAAVATEAAVNKAKGKPH